VVCKEIEGPQDQQEMWDHRERKVHRVLRAIKDLLGRSVLLVLQEFKELLEQLAQLALKDLWVNQVHLEQMETLELKDQLDQQGHRVLEVQVEMLVLRDRVAKLVLPDL